MLGSGKLYIGRVSETFETLDGSRYAGHFPSLFTFVRMLRMMAWPKASLLPPSVAKGSRWSRHFSQYDLSVNHQFYVYPYVVSVCIILVLWNPIYLAFQAQRDERGVQFQGYISHCTGREINAINAEHCLLLFNETYFILYIRNRWIWRR